MDFTVTSSDSPNTTYHGLPMVTRVTNTTSAFDYYCTEMPMGPWVWGCLSIPCSCVGVSASVWLLLTLIQRQRSGLTNDVYMLNLTIMDLIFNVFIIPGVLNYFVWKDDIYSKIADILYCFQMAGRPLFMSCVCVDCYLAVVYPITYMKMKHSRYRMVACTLVWGFTLLYGIAFVTDRQIYTSLYTCIPYLLSLPVIAICDLTILHTLRKPDPSGRNDVHPQKQRALQTITNSLVMTMVSFLPPMIMYGLQSVIPIGAQRKMCDIGVPAVIPPMIGCTIMPLLYLNNLGCLEGLLGCKSTVNH